MNYVAQTINDEREGETEENEAPFRHVEPSFEESGVFDELYINLVAAGETGGILDTILLRLATFLEKNDALVRKIKGAMVYPAVIFAVAAWR